MNTNKKTIRGGDLFCGAGGTSSGLRDACDELGLSLRLTAINHWDMAIATHTANHPDAEHYCEDIALIDPLKAVPEGRLEILVASPECFPAGTLILTASGLKPIENVSAGDCVLTHAGRWQPVTSTMTTRKDTIVVRGHGHYGIETTAEHPFFASERKRVWHNNIRRWRLHYSSPEWVPAGELAGHFWATPTTADPLPIPGVPQGDIWAFNECFWWMIGRWLGDGSVAMRPGKGGEITICCGNHEADELEPKLRLALQEKVTLSRRTARTATLFEFRNTRLAEWLLEHFGKLAHLKTVPSWMLGLRSDFRRSFLDGYCSADGHVQDGRKQEITTVSKSLAVGVRLVAESLGFRVALYSEPQHNSVIEGRKVNARDIYRVMWIIDRKHDYGTEIAGHSYSRVRSVELGRKDVQVFNLSVATDESFIADGIVVHNCTHHSNARGGKPMQDQSRATAWHVLWWAQKLDIRNILIENVREFEDWGPLGANGRPLKSRKGETFRAFLHGLRSLGYTVAYRVLNAADYGDATTRQRLFIQARKGVKKITWPQPTHFPPSKLETIRIHIPTAQPWRPAREIINWDIRGESIYTRKRPLSDNTMRRILAGLRKYSGLPFIVPQFSSQGPRSVDDPVGTITTTSRGVAFVQPFVVGAGGPTGAGRPQSVNEPLGTVMTQDHRAIVTPYLVVLQNNRDALSLERPVPAVLTSGAHFGVCEGFIVPVTHQGGDRVKSVSDPLVTVTCAKRGELAFVVPEIIPANEYLVKYYEGSDAASVDSPLPSVTANYEHLALAQPFLVVYHGERPGQEPRTGSLDNPLTTIDTSNRLGLAQPFLIPYYSTAEAVSLDDPLDTVTTRDRFALVSPEFASMLDKGQVIGYLDILFRMLTDGELAAAQSYEKFTFQGNREQRVKQIGNGVPRRLAKALCLEMLRFRPERGRKVPASLPVTMAGASSETGDLFVGSEARA